MPKIIGNTIATPNPRPDWNQTDKTKADYIKNKPEQINIIDENSTDKQYATAKAIYDFGQKLKISGGGGTGNGGSSGGTIVQSDYLQNDPSANDYIKNRPFYSEGEKTEIVVNRDIIPLQEVEFTGEDMLEGILAYQGYTNLTPLVNKGQYNLTIDDTEYLITLTDMSSNGSGQYVAGNLGLVGGDDTGEPFYFAIFPTTEAEGFDGEVWQFGIAYQTNETTHTIGLSYISDTAPIIAEGTYTFNEKLGAYYYAKWNSNFIHINLDDVLNLTINDQIYQNLSWSVLGEETYYLGNISIINSNFSDTGENWVLYNPNDTEFRLYTTILPAGDYTVSLEKVLPTTTVTTEVLHKIDPKFIPTPDYSQNDPNGEGYIKNRPFYSEVTVQKDIIPVQEIEFGEDDVPEGYAMGYLEITSLSPIILNTPYYFTFDDTTTEIVFTNPHGDDYFYFGNLSIMGMGDDTGEPYVGGIIYDIGEEYGEVNVVYQTTAGIHNVGFSYIGDTIPLIPEGTYTAIDPGTDYPFGIYQYLVQGFYPQGDEKYNFTFDNEHCDNLELTCMEEEIYVAGNMGIVGEGDDTGEDYILICGPGMCMVYSTTKGDHTISLELASLPTVETIQKMDAKYIDGLEVYSDGINALQQAVGIRYSDLLYKHFQIDREEYPYIYITAQESGHSRLFFLESTPSLSGSSCYIYGDYYLVELSNTHGNGDSLEYLVGDYLDISPSQKELGNYINPTVYPYNYINFNLYIKDFPDNWTIFDENTIIKDVENIKSELAQIERPVQSDYSQNDSTSLDYIKNRPFYVEKQVVNDPSKSQTVYDSINTNSASVKYNSTGYDYTSTNITDMSLKEYLVNGIGVVIVQKIAQTLNKTTTTYYITRSGVVKSDGNNLYVGNLNLHTHNGDDHTGEDYVFYYNSNNGQITLHLSTSATCDDNSIVSNFFNTSNQTVDLTISVSGVFEDIYHKIDPNFLPEVPYTIDADGNIVFSGKITADQFILSAPEGDEEEAGRTSQTYVILTDIKNGFDYAVQMEDGYLTTRQLPLDIQITTLPDKMVYYRGDYFDSTGMVLTATYPNGVTEVIEDASISYADTSFTELGDAEVVIKVKAPTVFKTSLTVNVIEFDPNTVLTDFTYTTNNDGTYTLTGWNQTFNGESSTELIVPNNSLIKL